MYLDSSTVDWLIIVYNLFVYTTQVTDTTVQTASSHRTTKLL